MSSSSSLSLKPTILSFHGSSHELEASRPFTITSNESVKILLVKLTGIGGRGFEYRVTPSLVYIKPEEKLDFEVTRLPLKSGKRYTFEAEWRDVLGVEAIQVLGEPEPIDQTSEATRDERWAVAVRTGLHITSWLVPMDHKEPEIPEIVVTETDETPDTSSALATWREVEKPGNWFRFHCSGTPIKAYFSALFWKQLEDRTVQECVIRIDDSEEIFPTKVAMKWMADSENKVEPGDGTRRSLVGRALQEFMMWRDLRHPNIVQLWGIVFWPNIGFLSSYCTNGRILKYIVDQKPSWDERKRLMQEIGNALVYLHQKGIVYGDLKEDNVLIDHNHHAQLIDFGLSISAEEAYTTPTFTGHLRYLAPEVAEMRTKSFMTDIYAYGLLILEIAIGRIAREEQGADHVAAANAYYYPALLIKHYPELRRSDSNVLWKLIVECTARTPDKRPRNMLFVLRSLERVSERDWVPNALA